MLDEPRANVAVIARDPERADIYYDGLKKAEVPRLTRVRIRTSPSAPASRSPTSGR
jgi:hypothetical protein